MATGEVKISALPLDVNPTGNDYAVTVDVDTNTNKKVPLSELSLAVDKGKLLSTDSDNLLTTGSDDGIRLEATADVISADAGNILQKGTDGKLLAPSVAASLTEDRMWIGGASNTPEEKTDLEVRQFLGLPTDYINDNIQYVSSNQVSWQGKCRDSSDSRDFELGFATTASLVGAVANTTYNLFVAGNTLTDTPVVVWDTGSTPAGYTYYRLVFSVMTDGVGNIPVISKTLGSSTLKVYYDTNINNISGSGNTSNTLLTMLAPSNATLACGNMFSSSGRLDIKSADFNIIFSSSNNETEFSASYFSALLDNSQVGYSSSGNPSGFGVRQFCYEMER